MSKNRYFSFFFFFFFFSSTSGIITLLLLESFHKRECEYIQVLSLSLSMHKEHSFPILLCVSLARPGFLSLPRTCIFLSSCSSSSSSSFHRRLESSHCYVAYLLISSFGCQVLCIFLHFLDYFLFKKTLFLSLIILSICTMELVLRRRQNSI